MAPQVSLSDVYERILNIEKEISELNLQVSNQITSLQTNCEVMSEKVQKLDEKVNGNGKVGIADRTLQLELFQQQMIAKQRRHDTFMKLIIGALIVAIIGLTTSEVARWHRTADMIIGQKVSTQ